MQYVYGLTGFYPWSQIFFQHLQCMIIVVSEEDVMAPITLPGGRSNIIISGYITIWTFGFGYNVGPRGNITHWYKVIRERL